MSFISWRAVVLVAVAVVTAVSAQERPAAPPPADLAHVPSNALGFVHVNVAAFLQTEVGKNLRQLTAKEFGPMQQEVEKRLGLSLDDLDRVTLMMLSVKEEAPLVVLSTLKPAPRERLLKALTPDAKEHQYKGKAYFTSGTQGQRLAIHYIDDRTILIGQAEDVVQLFKRLGRGRADGLLSPALRRAEGKSHLVASVVVPEEFVDQFQKESGRVGDQRPLESAIMATVQPLLEAHVLTATAELDKTVSFKLHLTFANKKAADEANGPAKDLLAVGRMLLRGITQQVAKERGTEALAALLKEVEIALQAATVESQGEQLQVAVTVKADAAVAATAGRGLFEGVLKVRQASERMQSANNLKQIALAMHNYHATHGHFPPQAITGKDDKPLLSWRVAILPYLEQDNLYRTFRLNEPWDSAHNKALLKQLPPVYAPLGAGKKEPGMTYYQGFTGKHALFDGLKGPRLTEITDGTSNTLLIVEAAEPVPWTKPDDLPFDVKKPLPKLGGLFAEGFQAAFCDGSVRFLPKTIKEATLRALITRDGGEVVEIDK